MSDFSYNYVYSDKAIMKGIGSFFKQKRLDKNLTQQALADRAAISRSTLSLMERGENIVLSNTLKVARVLEVLYVFDHMHKLTTISPMMVAEAEAKMRKKASRKKDGGLTYQYEEW